MKIYLDQEINNKLMKFKLNIDGLNTLMSFKSIDMYTLQCINRCKDICKTFIDNIHIKRNSVKFIIIKSLLCKEENLVKSMIFMCNNNLIGKSSILRSLCEIYIYIGWLLYSNSKTQINHCDSPFYIYELKGSFNLKRAYDQIEKHSDRPLDKKIESDIKQTLKRMSWSHSQINTFIQSSNSKIRRKTNNPNIHDMMKILPIPKESILGVNNIYRTLCDDVHSNSSNIVNQIFNNENGHKKQKQDTSESQGYYTNINFLNTSMFFLSQSLLLFLNKDSLFDMSKKSILMKLQNIMIMYGKEYGNIASIIACKYSC